MSPVLPVVLLFAAATTALVGWAVYRGDAALVAGYDPDRVEDEAGLTRFVGRGTLLIAGLTAALGVLSVFVTLDPFTVGVYTALVVLIAAWPVVGTRRFEN